MSNWKGSRIRRSERPFFVCFLAQQPPPPVRRASSITRFLDHTQRSTTVGKTPLDVWSARRRDLYLTTHNTHNRQTSMPPVGFEPTISASERPQTYALDRAATETGRTPLIPLTPNDLYMSRTAPLTSKRCILYIYSTNISTEYFKHALYSPFFLFKMQFVS